MYVFPSTSVISNPSASLMNGGVPPTALNARTGELTPPGITCFARAKAASELAVERVVRSGMTNGSSWISILGLDEARRNERDREHPAPAFRRLRLRKERRSFAKPQAAVPLMRVFELELAENL